MLLAAAAPSWAHSQVSFDIIIGLFWHRIRDPPIHSCLPFYRKGGGYTYIFVLHREKYYMKGRRLYLYICPPFYRKGSRLHLYICSAAGERGYTYLCKQFLVRRSTGGGSGHFYRGRRWRKGGDGMFNLLAFFCVFQACCHMCFLSRSFDPYITYVLHLALVQDVCPDEGL